ncbi:ATP-dependent DNA helicase RecG [Clostridium sp. ATCC 25772]|uniref:ATP-dependent DNA helicase RecG n=1 Tax=Clostridium sp. ATCC 25772 TaxID=1676991 RepID=UPI000783EAEF|nr:ATP-dependent DNA helicase RecG [Clostridium sp. ATCC 25772]
MNIYDDITFVKGVGPKMGEKLNKCGIYNVLDLLLYFPRDYDMVKIGSSIEEFEDKEKVILECTVKSILRDIRTKNNKILSTVIFNCGNNNFKGQWFNQPYAKNSFRVNSTYVITGKVEKFNGEYRMSNPKILKNTSIDKNKILAKYSLKDNLNNSFLNKIISDVLSQVRITENLPAKIVEKYQFMPLDESIRNIHSPKDRYSLEEARRRLKFQELFAYSMKIFMLKELNKSSLGIGFKMTHELRDLKDKLPFQLTEAQSRVVREILIDEKRNVPMNRLVQGDVGSGKTIVALISLFNVIKNGYQAAMMAPTEILAKQHYFEATTLFEEFGINIQLLTGSTTAKNKEIIKNDLKEGKIDLLIGTHALIEEDVVFKNLGMIVTDEQHRFGVNQRNKLSAKSENADVLVMSATPIPRTLTLCLYGDLDVSVIDKLPPGRKKVDTYYLDKKEKNRAYDFTLKEISMGRQVYIVCPLVEENEDLKLSSVETLYNELKNGYFKNIEVAILHGKMPNKEKNAIMEEFKNGNIKVLVSTTVIEVGVNVPNSTVMIIENAERFGLSQLHQLRGRVGRGSHKSYCILIANIKSDTTKRRMETMKNSNDGFYIAEEDLRIRGGGELFGFRQSGENNFLLADLVEDFRIFKAANMEAKEIVNSESSEDKKVKIEIKDKLERSSKYICFN